jgi:hypothetical protein
MELIGVLALTWSKVFTRRQGTQAQRLLPYSRGTSAWLSRLIGSRVSA